MFKVNTAASRSAWYEIVETQNIKFMATRKERKTRNQFKNQCEGSVCLTPFVLLRATYSRRVHQVKEETTQVTTFLRNLFVSITCSQFVVYWAKRWLNVFLKLFVNKLQSLMLMKNYRTMKKSSEDLPYYW